MPYFSFKQAIYCIFSTILFLIACQPSPPSPAEAPAQTFTEGLNIHLNSIVSKNISKFESTLSRELPINMIFPDGEMVEHIDTILRLHEEWFAGNGWVFEYQILRKEVTAAMAYALLDIDYTKKDDEGKEVKRQFYLNLVFKLVDGKWKLIHDQNTIHS